MFFSVKKHIFRSIHHPKFESVNGQLTKKEENQKQQVFSIQCLPTLFGLRLRTENIVANFPFKWKRWNISFRPGCTFKIQQEHTILWICVHCCRAYCLPFMIQFLLTTLKEYLPVYCQTLTSMVIRNGTVNRYLSSSEGICLEKASETITSNIQRSFR